MIKMIYETIVKSKNDSSEIDRLQDWIWPKSDDGGTWGDDGSGPRGDWITSHSRVWFNRVKQFRVAIQAGGACGMYPRLLSEKFETVYTFEASPLSFHCLVNNCQEDNIIKFQCALGESACQVAWTFVQSNVGLSHVHKGAEGAIPMMPLDAFNFSDVDLIALDTEGYEGNILRGAVNTINRWKPIIIIENAQNCEAVWKSLGYSNIEGSIADSILVPE